MVMKFCLLALLVVVGGSVVLGYSNLNKTPKALDIGWTDSCEECQTIIKRIVAVAKDPTKVAELKILLEALCHETSYETECRLFVSKLDLFLDRLLPYLRDAHHVCSELHICSNRRLEQFHRVGMLYARQYRRREDGAKDLICEECQLAAHEIQQEISDPKFQQDILDWLRQNVCAYFGSLKDTCDEFLTNFMPEFWQDLQNILADQKKFCQELELCPASAGGEHRHQLAATTRRHQLRQKVSRHLMLAPRDQQP